ncbi:autotransporter domain-containing protein [Devosia ginsengisoli]|uniref:autotransporter outer membrane beta-barrel domain-containing protein n=1 Tax=Devosia ginsengisoli TaxID=400770 RepID=UPI0026EE7A23|nr:autotransporter domain-containing protein [Devosia ginsengisoli]MCR6670545.1 autotransporter domain-containing protein [Devosia ginsengisoli]
MSNSDFLPHPGPARTVFARALGGISALALILATSAPAKTDEVIDTNENHGVFGVYGTKKYPNDLESPWIVDGYLSVGFSPYGFGTLIVGDGGRALADATVIGWTDGSTGTVQVWGTDAAGNASRFTTGELEIGKVGSGRLEISAGGIVESHNVRFGSFKGVVGTGRGTASIGGSGTKWIIADSLFVGDLGQGTMDIWGGASVSSTHGYVGNESTGTVTVSGTDSTGYASNWSSTGILDVGSAGTGKLTISNGGMVSSGGGYIGRRAGGSGRVELSDAGSSWVVQNSLRIGYNGDSVGVLTLKDDALLAADLIELGVLGGSRGTLLIGSTGMTYLPSATGTLITPEIRFGHGSGTLFFNHTDEDYALAARLVSTGSGTHVVTHAAGSTLLTGDSSGFAGTTSVSGGTLLIGGADGVGSLGGSFEVSGLGKLGGSGTIGTFGSGVNIGAGGVLAPGNSIGTLTAAGDVTFDTGSIYEVELAGGGGTPGVHNDLFAIGGTARLDGGTVSVVALQNGQAYTILTAAGGVSGAFEGAVPLSAFITPTLTYDANDVVLTIALNTAPTGPTNPTNPTTPGIPTNPPTGLFTQAALTHNQTQAAIGLDDLDQTAGSDALAVYNQILMLSADDARMAFDLTSGEVHASAQQVIDQTFSLFGANLRQQGTAGLGGEVNGQTIAAPLAYAPMTGSAGNAAIAAATADANTPMANVWLAPLGSSGTIDGDGNAAKLDWWNAGLAGGYEGSFNAAGGDALAGFGLGYMRGHGTIEGRLSGFDANGFFIGTYGAWEDGRWALAGSLAYGTNHIATERRVIAGGLARTAEADYWTHTLGLSGEAAYSLTIGDATIVSPLVTVDASWSGHGGFTETGAGAADLSGASESWMRFDTGIGVALEHSMPTDTGMVTLRGRAVWEHALADAVPSQTLAFAGSPTSFEVRGAVPDRDRIRLGTGITWDISEGTSLRADYTGLFSGGQSSHGGVIGFNVRF